METKNNVNGLRQAIQTIQSHLDSLGRLQAKHLEAKAKASAEIEQAKREFEALKVSFDQAKISSLLDGSVQRVAPGVVQDALEKSKSLEGVLSQLDGECSTRERAVKDNIRQTVQALASQVEDYCSDSLSTLSTLIRSNPVINECVHCVGVERTIEILNRIVRLVGVEGTQLDQIPRQLMDAAPQPKRVQNVLNNLNKTLEA